MIRPITQPNVKIEIDGKRINFSDVTRFDTYSAREALNKFRVIRKES